MKILIDAFGCDNPEQFISGIATAINGTENVTLVVAGDKKTIENILKGEQFDRNRLEILDASEVISNEDSPVLAIRRKKNSSLVVAYENLKKSDEYHVMISAGNTGAVIAGAVLLLGRENSETRPTLATFFPNEKGTMTCLADCGANVDCRAEHLLQFATHASGYVKKVYAIESPRVALLSVGTEDQKGNQTTKEAFELLKKSNLNFVGNMEAKTALSGEVDVIVADGFWGNVLLKTIEGTAKFMMNKTLELLLKNAEKGVDLSFVKKTFYELKQTIDFNSLGGAVLLGAKKPIIKAHGSANAETMVNTVKQAVNMINSGYIR